MRLILVRHAKAEKYGRKKDYDRNLSEKGILQCENLKTNLSALNLGNMDVHYSASKRTTATFQKVESILNIKKVKQSEALYLASLNELLKYIWESDFQTNTLMLIGHNPGISSLCSYFLDEDMYFKTAEGAVIDFELDSFNELSKGTGILIHKL